MTRTARRDHNGRPIASRSQISLSRSCRPNLQRGDTWFVVSEVGFTVHLPSLHQKPVAVIVFSVAFAATTETTMGLSLEQSPFLQTLSGNGPQRIRSSVTELLKVFEQSSKSGPRYLNQLEEIVRFASGGSVTGTHAILSIHDHHV